MVRRVITKLAVWIIPLLLDAVCIGVKRWMRNKQYKRFNDLPDQNHRRYLDRY